MGWPDPRDELPIPGSIPLIDPRNAAWLSLLPMASAIIADAGAALTARLTLGGGSILAMRYGHRESRDLDFFLPDAQLLGLLTPRLNDRIARLTDGYEEASNFVRFTFGAQEIDFIVGAPVLDRAPTDCLGIGAGLAVPIEPPGEIIAKKLLYRGSGLTHRDVLDLALVAALEPVELEDVPARLGAKALGTLADRLADMNAGFAEAAATRVRLRPGFEGLLHHGLAIANAAITRMRA